MVSDRIRTVMVKGYSEDRPSHLYTKFIGDGTELWIFGEGLGERCMITQIGDSFLSLMDAGRDPHLGRIMLALGENHSAQAAYRGDFNVCWVWGLDPESVGRAVHVRSVRPDLIITSSPHLRRLVAEELGISTACIFAGVNTRFFHPLGLARKGLGYCGVDNKSQAQIRIVLGPARERGLEWISGGIKIEYPDNLDLNTWMNGKQILFGMVQEDRQGYGFIPTRFTETLATDTPLIIYRLPSVRELMGFDYPFFTESAEETASLIEEILGDYSSALAKVKPLGERVRREHSYEVKLTELFKILGEMRK